MKEEFGNLIRQWRKERRFSQEALANSAGISERTLRRWELGEMIPSATELEATLTALGVTVQQKQQAYYLIPSARILRLSKTLAAPSGAAPMEQILVPHLGDLLRAMRLRCHKTQAQCAAEMGVTPTTLTRWETAHSFPSDENLARICLLLKASPEERIALTSRNLPLSPPSSPDSPERLWEQIAHLKRMIQQHSPLAELYSLSLTRNLIVMQPDTAEFKHLFANALLHHSTVHLWKGDQPNAKKFALHAKSLFIETRNFDKSWADVLNLLSVFAGKSTSDDLTRIHYLRKNLPFAPPGITRMQLLCDIALYFSNMDKQEEALRVIQMAEAECRRIDGSVHTRHYLDLTSGKITLAQNHPEKALRHFEAAAVIYSLPQYSIYQAQAAAQMGEKTEAARIMQNALHLVEKSPMLNIRRQMNDIVQQILV